VSEQQLLLRKATDIVSARLNITTYEAEIRLTEAIGAGKIHITVDPKCEQELIDAATARLPPQTAIKPDDARAALAESARQGALALSVLFLCGMVSQDELLNWLNLTAGPDLAQVKEPKTKDILEAARAVYEDPQNNDANKDKAEQLIRQWLAVRGLKGPRAKIRPILNRKEFASRRNKQGVRKRR
jgi:hypothetical protein